MDWTHVAVPFVAALIALESIVAAFQGRKLYAARHTLASLALKLGSVVADLAWKGVVLASYYALYAITPLRLGDSPLVWAAALLADDFCYYWAHRLHHEVRVFWASHVVHHSSQRYNLLDSNFRQAWTPMTGLPFWLPLPLLGFDPLMLLSVNVISGLYQFWVHTEAIGRLGPLEAVLNTPSHHRVHHGSNPRYLDRNYGGILMVWDRLFGTFEVEREAPVYGLTKNLETSNPVRIAFHEWVAVARDALRPNPLAVRLGYLLRPPGWSPDGSTRTASEMRAALEQPALEALEPADASPPRRLATA